MSKPESFFYRDCLSLNHRRKSDEGGFEDYEIQDASSNPLNQLLAEEERDEYWFDLNGIATKRTTTMS